MQNAGRPFAFWIIAAFLAVSIVLMLLGQTMAVFNYDLAVRLGLQESVQQVSQFGVAVNRGFGVGDTIIYVPLLLVSLAGLILKKRWALLATAAVAGVSAYWATTALFIHAFLRGVTGYSFVPGPELWLYVGAYLAFGVWCLIYLAIRGESVIQ